MRTTPGNRTGSSERAAARVRALVRAHVTAACVLLMSAPAGAGGPDPDPPDAAGAAGAVGAVAVRAGEPASGDGAARAPHESLPLGVARRPTDAGAGSPGDPAAVSRRGGWWRTAASLALVLGIIGLGGLVLRAAARRSGGLAGLVGAGGRAPAGLLEVLGRYPIARGQTLVLLKLDRRVLLVSQSAGGRLGGGGFRTLCDITDPEEVASILVKAQDEEGASISQRFRALLSGAESVYDEAGASPGRPARAPSGEPRAASVWQRTMAPLPMPGVPASGEAERGEGGASPAITTVRQRLAALQRVAGGAA